MGSTVHPLYDVVRDFSSPAMYLVQNIILAITAAYAFVSIKENKSIAKKRAALDLILFSSTDEEYIKARRIVVKMRKEGKISPASLRTLISSAPSEDERDRYIEKHNACQYILIRLELFSNAVQKGIIDEETFKSHYYSTFMTFVEYLRGYVIDIRDAVSKEGGHISKDTIYQENFWLYERWKNKALKADGRRT